jgi:hypothetical protein
MGAIFNFIVAQDLARATPGRHREPRRLSHSRAGRF